MIPNTANEFPFFSFLLGDLHAHVLAAPFALTALAFTMQICLSGPRLGQRDSPAPRACAVGRAASRRTRPRGPLRDQQPRLPDGGRHRGTRRRPLAASHVRTSWLPTLVWAGALDRRLGSALPAVLDGLRTDDERHRARRRAHPLQHVPQGRVPDLRPPAVGGRDAACSAPANARSLPGLGGRSQRSSFSSCSRRHVSPTSSSRSASPRSPCSSRWRVSVRRRSGSSGCWSQWEWRSIGIGEFVYIRDSFDGTASFRFNTVFKAGYQAWLLLSIVAAGCMVVWNRAWLRGWLGRFWRVGLACLVAPRARSIRSSARTHEAEGSAGGPRWTAWPGSSELAR